MLVPDGLSAPTNVIRLVRQVGDGSGPGANGSSIESDEYDESETGTEEEEYTEDTIENDEEGTETEVSIIEPVKYLTVRVIMEMDSLILDTRNESSQRGKIQEKYKAA